MIWRSIIAPIARVTASMSALTKFSVTCVPAQRLADRRLRAPGAALGRGRCVDGAADALRALARAAAAARRQLLRRVSRADARDGRQRMASSARAQACRRRQGSREVRVGSWSSDRDDRARTLAPADDVQQVVQRRLAALGRARLAAKAHAAAPSIGRCPDRRSAPSSVIKVQRAPLRRWRRCRAREAVAAQRVERGQARRGAEPDRSRRRPIKRRGPAPTRASGRAT